VFVAGSDSAIFFQLLEQPFYQIAFFVDVLFATKIDIVDTQHKRLFDLLNALAESFKKDGPSEALVTDAMNQLVSYADKHFTEEELMKEYQLDPRHVNIHHLEHHSFMYDTERL
jgi:hemerythrin-like metal-binding protein